MCGEDNVFRNQAGIKQNQLTQWLMRSQNYFDFECTSWQFCESNNFKKFSRIDWAWLATR